MTKSESAFFEGFFVWKFSNFHDSQQMSLEEIFLSWTNQLTTSGFFSFLLIFHPDHYFFHLDDLPTLSNSCWCFSVESDGILLTSLWDSRFFSNCFPKWSWYFLSLHFYLWVSRFSALSYLQYWFFLTSKTGVKKLIGQAQNSTRNWCGCYQGRR